MHAPLPMPEQMALLSGALTHLSQYLQSGCPRAAQQARMLLHRIEETTDDSDLFASCAVLDRAMDVPRAPAPF